MIFFFTFWNLVTFSQSNYDRDNFSSSDLKYNIDISVIEFSILNGAMVDGLTKYQGNLDFSLNMTIAENQVFYNLSSKNKRLIEVLCLYVAQKSVELLKVVDLNNPSQNDKLALNAISSLSGKLENTLKNPIWEIRKVVGSVEKSDNNFQLKSKEKTLMITGDKVNELESFIGKQLIINGHIKEQGKIEIVNFRVLKTNTLELFVMSLCPYGNKAISFVLDKLDQIKNNSTFEIHYVFYKKNDQFTSLHGEKEVEEDLIQMIIRDQYSWYFIDYLKQRIKYPAADWKEIAAQIKLKGADINAIQVNLTKNRFELLQKEYQYSIDNFQRIDASPTWVWESEIVQNPNDIEILKGAANLDSEKCINQ
jgi:hypothetical protein